MIRHSYISEGIDRKKVEADAHKRANERLYPRTATLIHHHPYDQDCPWKAADPIPGPNTMNDPHLVKMYGEHTVVVPPIEEEEKSEVPK